MASVTTTGTGNTKSTVNNAPWPGGVIPAITDTIIIGDGFTLTNNASDTFECGNSPADDTGTPALQCVGAAGTGVFVNNGTFRFKGPVRQARGTWTIGPDAICEHDSSAAAVPATANYSWKVGQTGGTATILLIQGTAGHRAIFRIAAGSGKCGGFSGGVGAARCGQIQATYASISDWGTAALNAAYATLSTAGDAMYFDNCLIDRCGQFQVGNVVNNTIWRAKNTSIRSPANASSWVSDGGASGLSVNPSLGDRRLENVYIEGQVFFFNAAASIAQCGMHFVNVILAGTTAAVPMLASGMPACAEWNNVLLWDRYAAAANPSHVPGGTFTRTILLRDGHAGNNPHFIESIKANLTVDGWVAEATGSNAVSGDLFQTIVANAAFNLIVKNGVAIPDASGNAFGSITNHSDSNPANGTTVFVPTVTVEHCTWQGQDAGTQCSGAGGGENNTAFAGMVPSGQSNIVWKATSGAGYVVKWANATTQVANSYGTYGHNCVYNLTGIIYHRYDTNPTIYNVAPGTGDLNVDPQFIDKTRNFLSWAQSVDATVTTWTNALNRFSLMNDDAGSIPGFTVSAAYDWIRAGWVPRNQALKGAAHDGGDMGAMPVDPGGASQMSRMIPLLAGLHRGPAGG